MASARPLSTNAETPSEKKCTYSKHNRATSTDLAQNEAPQTGTVRHRVPLDSAGASLRRSQEAARTPGRRCPTARRGLFFGTSAFLAPRLLSPTPERSFDVEGRPTPCPTAPRRRSFTLLGVRPSGRTRPPARDAPCPQPPALGFSFSGEPFPFRPRDRHDFLARVRPLRRRSHSPVSVAGKPKARTALAVVLRTASSSDTSLTSASLRTTSTTKAGSLVAPRCRAGVSQGLSVSTRH